MSYAKIVLQDGTEYPLDACNISDIKGAFRDIADVNNGTYNLNKYLKMKKGHTIYTWEEFENTKKIIDSIPWPDIDY